MLLCCHQQQFFPQVPYTLLMEKCSSFRIFCSFCTDTTDSLLHFSTSCFFSNISKTKREQEKLVWSQSLRGSYSRWPVEENWEMHQHPQSQMEATAHCVSQSLAGIIALIWYLITFMIPCCSSYTYLSFFLKVCLHASSLEYFRFAIIPDEFAFAWRSKELS